MAGTYSQIYLQIVIGVKYRENLIQKIWKDRLFQYISGIITNKSHKSIIVNGVSDHVHLFIGFKPAYSISDLVRDVKNNSSNFINDNKFVHGKFMWQEGYGVFSYSHSHIESVYNYIKNQEKHHAKKCFKDEYIGLLNKFNIQYDEKYLFNWI
jgi:REP element-mobilizing transposase RayT